MFAADHSNRFPVGLRNTQEITTHENSQYPEISLNRGVNLFYLLFSRNCFCWLAWLCILIFVSIYLLVVGIRENRETSLFTRFIRSLTFLFVIDID